MKILNRSKPIALSRPRMKSAGRVKMAPATTRPEAAPIDWMMTFSRMVLFLLNSGETPTAMMAMGMAASNTWPIFSPRKAAAAEKTTAMIRPRTTERTVTSGSTVSAAI